MFTDMVGYTVMAQKNEASAVELLEEHRKLLRPIFRKHTGKEIATIGDAFLVEFASALDAVRCSIEIQSMLKELNERRPEQRKILLRIGIHLGDVIHTGKNVSGDAVNVASRIEPLAMPGGVCLTAQVYSSVVNKVECGFESIGNPQLKNVTAPIEVFRITKPGVESTRQTMQVAGWPKSRVAVLPFANMSPDPNDAYFADGITEEIISTVSSVGGLNVISRTSVMGYKTTTKKLAEIANELRVGSVLEGSFRKAGNKIRITTQLIDTDTDLHLWSQSYDRELNDVFAVQADIAKQVADALRVKILSTEMNRIQKAPTQNTAAYALYLKGRDLWNRRGLEDIKKAAGYFEQAIKEDPGFALGYSGLADVHWLLYINWGIDNDANRESARVMIARALELDPDLAEGHATRAEILWYDFKIRESEEEFRKAIELKPNYATAHQWYFWALLFELRWEEALAQIEKAVELDPLSPAINTNHAQYYSNKRDYVKFLELMKKAVYLNPDLGILHLNLSAAYGFNKMFDEAKHEAEIGAKLVQDAIPRMRIGAEAYLAWIEGDRQTVARLLPEIKTRPEELAESTFGIAAYHFYLEENDKGFEWLEKAFSERDNSIWSIQLDPRLDKVRTDPRYLSVLERLGLRPK
jgi:adenylate cyclase